MLKSIAVKDYMSAHLITFTPDMDLLTAINKLIHYRISGAPVVDEHGTLIGMLSERDFMKIALFTSYDEHPAGKVSGYMSRTVETVDAEASICEVAEKFIKGHYRRYPVLWEQRLVGQISRHDVLKALAEFW